jgi:hypothetical protein
LPCKAVVASLAHCEPVGCAIEDTPEAEANKVKNTLPSAQAAPKFVALDDFERLQAKIKSPQGLAVSDRKIFHDIKISRPREGGTIETIAFSEGDLVEVMGYIVGTPHARRFDPANCLLIGRDNNGYRIDIARLPGDTEYDSILVEMIPRGRNTWWTLGRLQRIRHEGLRVHVVGKLFYDNKHLVNSDPDEAIVGEPKRMSLWEIHPVSIFELCPKAKHDACKEVRGKDWIKLEEMDE